MTANRWFDCRMAVCALLGLLLAGMLALAELGEQDIIRFGLVTDIHAHDIDSPTEGKWMSHTEERINIFVTAMNEWEPDFVIELGDFINGWVVLGAEPGDPARIPDILAWAAELFSQLDSPAFHVIGNHDLYNLDKAQYLDILDMETTYYSFHVGAYHFIVLDVQFAEDGSDLANTFIGVTGFLPEPQFEWLRTQLASSERPTIVFVHQMLDDFIEQWGRPTVINQLELRQLFADDGDVIAVFQGHAHDNFHNIIDGIHYVTFEAMVDHDTPPTWAQITLDHGAGKIIIEGFGAQTSYQLFYSGGQQ